MSKDKPGFRVELIALAVIGIGVILLLDWTPFKALVDALIANAAQQLTLANLIGLVLVIGGVVFIGWRARVRFLNSTYWRAMTCPRCGSALHRVHRTPWDKAMGKTFLPHARRYRCERPECGWTGLRHSRRQSSMQ